MFDLNKIIANKIEPISTQFYKNRIYIVFK